MQQQPTKLAVAFALDSGRAAVLISAVAIADVGATIAIAIIVPGAALLAIRVMRVNHAESHAKSGLTPIPQRSDGCLPAAVAW